MSFYVAAHQLLADGSRGREFGIIRGLSFGNAWEARVQANKLESEWHGARGHEVIDGNLFKSGALPPVEVSVPSDEFDNIVRKWGIGYCCEWFGNGLESPETMFTLRILQARNRGEHV
jgi:hypothetical protein